MQMSRATYDGAKQNNKRPFVLTRATYSGGQRYSAVWTGDNDAFDDHMLLGVRLVNSLGLSGFAFAGMDIGGFANDPTKDLFQRWLSIGIYTPFFRNHAMIGTRDKEPWAMGEQVESDARKQIELRYQLLPYLYSMFFTATTTGLPVSRSLAITNSLDENVYYTANENEFMFGDALLVAPCKSTDQYSKVYLPDGTWYRFSSDKKYEGLQYTTVESPVSNLPVFVKGGSIIPMQSIIQNTKELPSDTLQVHIYNGTDSTTFTYYEDDGNSFNYENGTYYQRNIKFNGTSKSLSFEKPKGNYTSQFKYYNIVFHGFETLENIIVTGTNENSAKHTLSKTSATTKVFLKYNVDSTFRIDW
jgi:alpha-glucosidase